MQECFSCEHTFENTVTAIHRDGMKETEVQVCEDCIDDYYFSCNGCEKLYNTDCRNIIRTGAGGENRFSYCVSCRTANTFRCNCCSSLHHVQNRRPLIMYYVNEHIEIVNPNGRKHVCNPCYDNHYRRCRNCQSDTRSNTMHANGAGHRICRACNEATVLIKRYSAQPTDYMPFRGQARTDGKPTMYMGVELEVLPKNTGAVNKERIAQKILPLVGDFSIFTFDRSVAEGWEIKTTPCTFDYHMRAWEPFFNYVEENNKLLQERGNNCGMHVHLSRDAMTPLQIGRFICFINDPNNRDFMRKIAERDTHFAAYHDGIKAVHNWKCLNHVENHYQAVNITKPQTIEVRIFSSMLKRENFYKNLEFLQALLDFTAPMSCGDFKDYKKFEDYINKRADDFPHLWAFLNPPKPKKPIKKKARRAVAVASPRFLDDITDEDLEKVAEWIGINPKKGKIKYKLEMAQG